MNRILPFLLVLATLAPAQQPAYRANDFSDFVGISGAPIKTGIHRGGSMDGAGKTFEPQVFHDLGIRNYRMPLKYALTLPDQPQQVEKVYRETGARAMMLIDHNKSVPEEITGLVKQYLPGSIAEVEGPNEVNNKFGQNLNLKYKGRTDEAAASLFMDDVYKSLKADPATKDIPVIAYTSIFSDYREARPHNSFDFGNVHSYQGYGVPSSSLLMNFTRFNNIYPAGATIKPFVPTECGYNVEADKANGTFTTGSLRAQALHIPMLLTEYFNHGIRRACLFAIHNADGYGLLESDLKTKRPSYFALKNLLDEIKDADWNSETLKWEGGTDFTPRALMFTMPDAPKEIHSLTLQKKSGEWLLLIWNEKQNFWQPDKRDIHNKPVPVTLKLSTPLQQTAEILTQNDKGAYDKSTAEIKDGNLTIPVPSSVAIVKLKPAEGAKWETTAPAAPSGLTGTATETEVGFSWQAVPDEDLAAYLVFRNDQFLTATNGLSFKDASPFIRPGLGYRYAVQAIDKAGNMSARSETVIKTPDKRPDFIVTSLETPEVVDGKYKLKGTFKNVGNGASPNGVSCTMVFSIDGRAVGFGANHEQSIAAGQSVTIEVTGGEAKPGTHVLAAHVDDINRIGGESNETNNKSDRTFVIGEAPKGTLAASGEPAPHLIDLTKEGTLDWIAWGTDGKGSYDRKKDEPGLFSEMGSTGNGYMDATIGGGVRLTWSDGEKKEKNEGSNTSFWLNNVKHGFEFSVPASTEKERTLKVIVGGINGASGRFVAKLSDGSAPEYVSTFSSGEGAMDWASVPGAFNSLYTVKFKAASPDAKLTVQWILDHEPNQFAGQARLQAATLSE